MLQEQFNSTENNEWPKYKDAKTGEYLDPKYLLTEYSDTADEPQEEQDKYFSLEDVIVENDPVLAKEQEGELEEAKKTIEKVCPGLLASLAEAKKYLEEKGDDRLSADFALAMENYMRY